MIWPSEWLVVFVVVVVVGVVFVVVGVVLVWLVYYG